MARPSNLGGLPKSGLAFSAPNPPRRYNAIHPYTVRRVTLKDRAPVCCARRGCASIPTSHDLAFVHHIVSCDMRITRDSPYLQKNETTYDRINKSPHPGRRSAMGAVD